MRKSLQTRAATVVAVVAALAAVLAGPVGARPTDAGQLDATFGAKGVVLVKGKPTSRLAAGAAVPASGGGVTVVANTPPQRLTGAGGKIVLFRYGRSGRPVRGFGQRGRVSLPVSDGAVTVAGAALQADRRLLVLATLAPRRSSGGQDLFIIRLLPDGRPDPTFGDAGRRILDFGADAAHASDIAVTPQGSVVMVGSLDNSLTQPITRGDMVIARLTPDGDLDPTFSGGKPLQIGPTNAGDYLSASSVAIQPDGTILVGGNTGNADRGGNFMAVARILPDGTPDPTIASLRPGVAILYGPYGNGKPDAFVNDLTLDARRGRIYLAGAAADESGTESVFLVRALRYDLNSDPMFSAGGFATATFRGEAISRASATVVDGRGRVVLAGSSGRNGRGALALARFRLNGKLDPGFGRHGRVRLGAVRAIKNVPALLDQPPGRLLALGNIGRADTSFALVRLTGR